MTINILLVVTLDAFECKFWRHRLVSTSYSPHMSPMMLFVLHFIRASNIKRSTSKSSHRKSSLICLKQRMPSLLLMLPKMMSWRCYLPQTFTWAITRKTKFEVIIFLTRTMEPNRNRISHLQERTASLLSKKFYWMRKNMTWISFYLAVICSMIQNHHKMHWTSMYLFVLPVRSCLHNCQPQTTIENNDSIISEQCVLFIWMLYAVCCWYRCLQLLRTYTLGDRNISIEILSEQSFNFHDTLNGTVNYEDPNMNVAYPVFSIHGNHDDPTGKFCCALCLLLWYEWTNGKYLFELLSLSGFGGVSSLDLLSTSGLVNYFGKSVNLSEIHLKPILLRKGQTQMALYGLSHIHDNRLARLFRDSKVVMERTPENSGEWFNMLVLHQNRADRGLKNYIPENILPNFLDLIMWGHEHDCRIWPEENPCNNFYVTQPGSSVATSLAEGEANDKHIGLLKVYKNKFKLEAIKLDTVRPFVFKSYNLANMVDDLDLDDVDAADKVTNKRLLRTMHSISI